MGHKESGAKSVRMVYFATEKCCGSRQETVTAEKPRYDVPQGVGVNNRYEAELTNQRRGSGSNI